MSDKLWVIFDEVGNTIFQTWELEFANFDLLSSKYDRTKCSIECDIAGYDDKTMYCVKNIETGEITCILRTDRVKL
jgi:hypothetical protein